MSTRSTARSTDTTHHVPVRLPDGGTVALRPLRVDEMAVLEAVFEGLSPQSRTQRYLVPTPRLTGSARRVLSNVDGRDHVAWVALLDDRPVGICRYVRTTHDTAEVAFEVVDAAQGRGIGTALLDAVTTVACAHGITWVEASVAPGNHASVVLLGRIGVRLTPVDGLLEGRARLHPLAHPSRVDRRAVLALDGLAEGDEPESETA